MTHTYVNDQVDVSPDGGSRVPAVVELRGVTKLYPGGTRTALENVDLTVEAGEMVFMTGHSGSGKSSLLKLLIGDERPSRGEIHVLGSAVHALPARDIPHLRRRLGVVFQDYRLLSDLTVHENVAFTLEAIGRPTHELWARSLAALEQVGLADKAFSRTHELSGGEQQRVAIARALVARPQILLADEPTGSLDPATGDGVMDLICSVNDAGTTVIVATHDHHLVNRLQRRVVSLCDGRIVSDRVGGYDAPERTDA
jgi:cell division transport system ATP-binding protein